MSALSKSKDFRLSEVTSTRGVSTFCQAESQLQSQKIKLWDLGPRLADFIFFIWLTFLQKLVYYVPFISDYFQKILLLGIVWSFCSTGTHPIDWYVVDVLRFELWFLHMLIIIKIIDGWAQPGLKNMGCIKWCLYKNRSGHMLSITWWRYK